MSYKMRGILTLNVGFSQIKQLNSQPSSHACKGLLHNTPYRSIITSQIIIFLLIPSYHYLLTLIPSPDALIFQSLENQGFSLESMRASLERDHHLAIARLKQSLQRLQKDKAGVNESLAQQLEKLNQVRFFYQNDFFFL